jgi:hypothetical protein
MEIFQKASVRERKIEIFFLTRMKLVILAVKNGPFAIRGVRDRNTPDRVERPF